MNRLPKLALALLLVSAVAVSGLSAQAAAGAGSADAKIFALDLGMVTGYSLNGNAPIVGRTFGLNLTITDNLAVGLVSTDIGAGPTAYTLMRLSYFLNPALGFNLYVGSDGSTAVGAGAFYNILKTKSDTGFSSALKLRLEYLFDVANGVAKGDIALALGSSIGL
jgi:hypothetical protein